MDRAVTTALSTFANSVNRDTTYYPRVVFSFTGLCECVFHVLQDIPGNPESRPSIQRRHVSEAVLAEGRSPHETFNTQDVRRIAEGLHGRPLLDAPAWRRIDGVVASDPDVAPRGFARTGGGE
eukprot:6243767-Pyramimonas_sp.AAC.1